MRDELLRILKRESAHDPAAAQTYIAMLERILYGQELAPTTLWIVVKSHDSSDDAFTGSDDVWVCLNPEAAWKKAAQLAAVDLRTVLQDDPDTLDGGTVAKFNLFMKMGRWNEALHTFEEELHIGIWYEIDEKQLII